MADVMAAGRKKNGSPDPAAEWLAVSDAARIVQISEPTIYRYVKNNEVRFKNRGNRKIVCMEDVKRMAAQKYARFPVAPTTTPTPVSDSVDAPIAPPVASAPEPVLPDYDPEPDVDQFPQPGPDRLALARSTVAQERSGIAAERALLEEEIARLTGELELLIVRESELDDAMKAIEMVEKLAFGSLQ
mgnify:CR=1 FL=1